MDYMVRCFKLIKLHWALLFPITFIIFLATACNSKWIEQEPVNPISEKVNPIWSFWLRPDSSYMFGLGPIIDGDRLILGDMKLNDQYELETPEIIRCYSISQRKLLWEWNDFYPGDAVPSTAGKAGVGVYNNKLLVFGQDSHYLIDMETGKTVWSEWFDYSCPISTVWGGYIYKSKRNNHLELADTTFLLVASLSDMVWKTVLEFPIIDHVISDIPLIVHEINENQDTLLYFQQRFANPELNYSRLGVYCYNLSQDKYVWCIDSISDAHGNAYGPIIRDDLMYYNSGNEMFCLTKKDGAIVWSKKLTYASLSSNYFLYENMLIDYEENHYFKAHDALTGNLLWTRNLNTFSPTVSHGNYFFVGNLNLSILDAVSGEIAYIIDSYDPVDGISRPSNFGQVPIIDEKNNVVYISDCFRFRCYNLTELIDKCNENQ